MGNRPLLSIFYCVFALLLFVLFALKEAELDDSSLYFWAMVGVVTVVVLLVVLILRGD